jgi:hypothetical protein
MFVPLNSSSIAVLPRSARHAHYPYKHDPSHIYWVGAFVLIGAGILLYSYMMWRIRKK